MKDYDFDVPLWKVIRCLDDRIEGLQNGLKQNGDRDGEQWYQNRIELIKELKSEILFELGIES